MKYIIEFNHNVAIFESRPLQSNDYRSRNMKLIYTCKQDADVVCELLNKKLIEVWGENEN